MGPCWGHFGSLESVPGGSWDGLGTQRASKHVSGYIPTVGYNFFMLGWGMGGHHHIVAIEVVFAMDIWTNAWTIDVKLKKYLEIGPSIPETDA